MAGAAWTGTRDRWGQCGAVWLCNLKASTLPPTHPTPHLPNKNPKQAFCGVVQAWLEQHGPVQALVDGANVALYGQNWERGAFSFGQIKGVMDQLGRTHPDLHPLMVSR